MRSYPVKEKHIGLAVSEILTHRQRSFYFIIRISIWGALFLSIEVVTYLEGKFSIGEDGEIEYEDDEVDIDD